MTLELLTELALLKEQNAQLVKERDAAVAYLYNEADYYGDLCYFCAKNNDSPCIKCEWEWRGVRDE